MSDRDQPWTPRPEKFGQWTAMFDERPNHGKAASPPPSHEAAQAFDDAELPDRDGGEYKPWTLQRGSGRPSMMIDFRRYDAKSGLWMGWQLAYSHLLAVEYIGDRIVSLDFGTRQTVIEGRGLDELARHLQQCAVTAVHEHSARLWGGVPNGALVTAIRTPIVQS